MNERKSKKFSVDFCLALLRETAEKEGKPYQSLVNEILAEEMRRAS
jgi:predicted DNA binding CopG/RHH family protein